MFKLVFYYFTFLVIIAKPSFAYVDPGSGSAKTSLTIALIVSAGVIITTRWHKIKHLFYSNQKKGGDPKQKDNNE